MSMLIQWSEEDAALLVTLPEWDGGVFNPVTHESTYETPAPLPGRAGRCLLG